MAKRAGALGLTTKPKTTSRDVRLPSARTLARFLAAAQEAVRLKGQVTVLLTTDAAIRKLNRKFLGKNKATDVLSFPASGLGTEGMAGDLAISVTTALGQAAEQGHSLAVELKVLVLHGLLHLAGYDHEADAGRMARRERALRGKLGLPQGLIERAETPAPSRRSSSGAKARVDSANGARGLKPPPSSDARFSAAFERTEGMRVARMSIPPGLKPENSFGPQLARRPEGTRSCPDTGSLAPRVFPQTVKSGLFKTAGKVKRA